jgi:hypothetical protein
MITHTSTDRSSHMRKKEGKKGGCLREFQLMLQVFFMRASSGYWTNSAQPPVITALVLHQCFPLLVDLMDVSSGACDCEKIGHSLFGSGA